MSYRRERRPTRWRVRSSLPNPIEDPLRKEKRKPGQVGRRLTPREQNEFAPIDVVEIRWRFDQTQAEFLGARSEVRLRLLHLALELLQPAHAGELCVIEHRTVEQIRERSVIAAELFEHLALERG